MKTKMILILSAFFLFSCAHHNTKTATAPANNADLTCQNLAKTEIKPELLTIEFLQKLGDCEQYDTLNNLFNHKSLHLDSLPVGYAAGLGGPIFKSKIQPAANALAMFATNQWKGKIFFPSKSGKESRGLNRLQSWLPQDAYSKRIIPIVSFVTKLVDRHPYVPEVDPGHSIVVLNYAHPARPNTPHIQERILENIPLYDMIVAVPGKYGLIYIGKTWLGNYSKTNGEFSAYDTKELIAWFFLDFNQPALDHQAEVDKFEEHKISLPRVNETNIRY